MNSVSPTGSSFANGRSDASKFLSQSENDVAAAFAELFRSEGLDFATAPPPAVPPSTSQADPSQRRQESSPAATASDAASGPNSGPGANGNSVRDDAGRDHEWEDDREESVPSAVAPATTPQTTSETTPVADDASSSEERELEALLADVTAVQKEAAAETESSRGPLVAASPESEEAVAFANLLADGASANAEKENEGATAPAAEIAPRVGIPSETEVADPLRRGGSVDEESDQGFAIDDVADDADVDEQALAELAAKAIAGQDDGRDAKASSRDDRSPGEREANEKAAEAVGATAPNSAEPVVEAPVVSPAVEGTLSASKSESTGVAAVAGDLTATVGSRGEEPSGSLLRSIERSSESDRRLASGPDRVRFMDRVERAFHAAEQGDGAIRMRLAPAELGSMQLTLERDESGEWIARIETETAEAKQALLENASALKERLAEQDFRLARFEVETPADRRQQQDARDFQENPQGFSKGRDRRDDERSKERSSEDAAPTGASSGDRSRRLDVTI